MLASRPFTDATNGAEPAMTRPRCPDVPLPVTIDIAALASHAPDLAGELMLTLLPAGLNGGCRPRTPQTIEPWARTIRKDALTDKPSDLRHQAVLDLLGSMPEHDGVEEITMTAGGHYAVRTARRLTILVQNPYPAGRFLKLALPDLGRTSGWRATTTEIFMPMPAEPQDEPQSVAKLSPAS